MATCLTEWFFHQILKNGGVGGGGVIRLSSNQIQILKNCHFGVKKNHCRLNEGLKI